METSQSIRSADRTCHLRRIMGRNLPLRPQGLRYGVTVWNSKHAFVDRPAYEVTAPLLHDGRGLRMSYYSPASAIVSFGRNEGGISHNLVSFPSIHVRHFQDVPKMFPKGICIAKIRKSVSLSRECPITHHRNANICWITRPRVTNEGVHIASSHFGP